MEAQGIQVLVSEHVVLSGQLLHSFDNAAQPVLDGRVVLVVLLCADVLGDLAGIAAHQHVFNQGDS